MGKNDGDEESGKGQKAEMELLQPSGDGIKCRYATAAIFVTLSTGFTILPDGQVDRFVLDGDQPELDLTLGAISGYATAALLAVVIGSIVERTVPVKRLLFCNVMGLACLCLWVGSSTFMHYHKIYLAPQWRAAEAKEAPKAGDVASLIEKSMRFGRAAVRHGRILES